MYGVCVSEQFTLVMYDKPRMAFSKHPSSAQLQCSAEKGWWGVSWLQRKSFVYFMSHVHLIGLNKDFSYSYSGCHPKLDSVVFHSIFTLVGVTLPKVLIAKLKPMIIMAIHYRVHPSARVASRSLFRTPAQDYLCFSAPTKLTCGLCCTYANWILHTVSA